MLISDAIRIAYMAHEGQLDKSNRPYILHPLAVMNSVEGEDAQVVAVLHDVIEDTPIRLSVLWSLTKTQRNALDAISRRPNEVYRDYIKRVKLNELATYVKFADLDHNMSPERMDGCNNSLMKRYLLAISILEK